ncbi:BTB/POZ domain-containing protein 6-A-like [Haliotis rubra]|uniref:BTB/POZ domain-containing protein 6-A-like n=1 Tax=Haliotis rubra TaxID=36100 RepID=UPI001EE602EB|nr:BTB/POZ domain-containing protein 6-A-like [Haliotis rubra]
MSEVKLSSSPQSPDSGYADDWQSGKTLTETNLHMLTTQNCCDVTFRVGPNEKVIQGHSYVLISRSAVFHAMLSGPLAEKDVITVPDIEDEIFYEMLKYLYTNEGNVTPENVTGLLYLAKKYSIGGLERQCLDYLEKSLSADNACVIMEQAHSFDEMELQDKALQIVISEGDVSLRTSGFSQLCHSCFHRVVSSEDLAVKPEHMFSAAMSWSAAECERKGLEVVAVNQRTVLGESLYNIRFSTMCREYFVKQVVPTGVLVADESNKILCKFVCSDVDVSPFTADPRLGVTNKTFTVSRFRSISTTSLLCQGDVVDSVTLTSSHDLYLHGIQLYCPFNEVVAMYSVFISVRISPGTLLPGSCLSTTIQAKPFEKAVFDVYLNAPVIIRKNVQHKVAVLINGGYTYQGTTGLSRVIHGSNCFQFTVSTGGRFRSSISEGQIPGFIFSEP